MGDGCVENVNDGEKTHSLNDWYNVIQSLTEAQRPNV